MPLGLYRFSHLLVSMTPFRRELRLVTLMHCSSAGSDLPPVITDFLTWVISPGRTWWPLCNASGQSFRNTTSWSISLTGMVIRKLLRMWWVCWSARELLELYWKIGGACQKAVDRR